MTDAQSPLLALDTSGPIGSVAVSVDGEVRCVESLASESRHASLILPTVELALERSGLDRRDVRGIVVGEGPGSFTGVRIGAATALGLARALSVPLFAVSSLAAAALAPPVRGVRYVLFDARSDRVYGACYGVGASEIQELVAPHAGDLRDVLASELPPGVVFLGDGAVRHEAAIAGAGFDVDGPRGEGIAAGLLEYMARVPGHPSIAAGSEWEPAYLRPSRAVVS